MQIIEYWAWPGAILPRSAVRQRFTKAAAPGPGDADLAEVADVEETDSRADGCVLGQDPGPRVLQRHRPAAELGELGAGGLVPVVDRGRFSDGAVGTGSLTEGCDRFSPVGGEAADDAVDTSTNLPHYCGLVPRSAPG